MKNIISTFLILFAFTFIVKAEEVSIVVNGCTLKGTLEIPKSDKPIDVALIIAGSGPTDRDGNSTFGFKSDSYKMLADSLFKYGGANR